jgi:hypothetical protein
LEISLVLLGYREIHETAKYEPLMQIASPQKDNKNEQAHKRNRRD